MIWDKYVTESDYLKDVNHFIDHYDIPPFEAPAGAQSTINAFFQAKYGMFYCYDSFIKMGLIEYDPTLISAWERNPKQLKLTWTLAVLCALNANSISIEEL